MLDLILDFVLDLLFGLLDLFTISRNEGMDRTREVLNDRVTGWLMTAGAFLCLIVACALWGAGLKFLSILFGAGTAALLIWELVHYLRTQRDW